jgi:hypothetical protein
MNQILSLFIPHQIIEYTEPAQTSLTDGKEKQEHNPDLCLVMLLFEISELDSSGCLSCFVGEMWHS